MKVNIAQVRRMERETVHYDLDEDFPGFEFGGEDITFAKPVHVQLEVTNTGKTLLVKGLIKTEMNISCGRCLGKFVYAADIPYEDEWVAAGQATNEQMETSLLYDKDEVEIQERIFEQIVLALPMKNLCSPECRGLCLVCGQNLNLDQCSCDNTQVDPRLADLAKWHQNH